MLQFFREFRNAVKRCGIKHIISYRNLTALVKRFDLHKDDMTDELKARILKQALVRNLNCDDLSQIYPKLDYTEYRNILEQMAEERY